MQKINTNNNAKSVPAINVKKANRIGENLKESHIKLVSGTGIASLFKERGLNLGQF